MGLNINMNLKEKLINKTAIISIIGLGYVGLPLAIRYADIGYKVIGLDIDLNKIDSINKGESYIEGIDSNLIRNANKKGLVVANDFSLINRVDAIILCVPTPLNKYREPDLSFVINAVNMITPHLRADQVVSLESTTYPGTTEEELLPRIEETGLIVGENIYLIYSPEREDPGNQNYETKTIPKVVGGHTKKCLEIGTLLYSHAIEKVIPVSSTKAAEMTKLLENIHRAVNVGLVNEMKIVADKMGIDIYEVIRAAASKPFGFTPYYPGPGLGGHCIPIDPFYLTWKAREYNLNTKFIEISGEINANMPLWVVGKVVDALNDRNKPVNGSKILVLGAAYKKDIDDLRESPAIKLMLLLKEKGSMISYSDPYIPNIKDDLLLLSSIELSPSVINGYDLILLATDHSVFDYKMILNNAKVLVDTRGVYPEKRENLVKA
jgi:UDP-N-acetyl-D-glucosamine dehydrogenase